MIRRTFLFLTAVSSAAFLFGQSDIDITISGDAERLNVPVYRVAISSDNADLESLAKRAFSTHGSYVLTTPAKAQFMFAFSQAGTNAVKVSIKGGTAYEETCNGVDSVNALMKACDVAVMRTLRSNGFFAGKIAFAYSKAGAKTSEICVSDFVFRNVRAITRDNSESLMPHFSPDGNKIMYTGYYRTGFMDLFEVNLASNSRKVFASYKGSNTGGAFSSDGSKVAMILTTSGNAEVWIANSSGGGFKRMTKTSATESSASFSPDGNSLVFASDSRGGPQIFTMSLTGGVPQLVRTNISGYCSEPDWSKASPHLIAFTIAQGRGFQVAVYDMKTKTSKTVSSGASTSGARWLSDGRHLICTKSVGNTRQLYIIDSETKRQTPLHSTSFGNAKEPDFVYRK